MKLNEGAPGMAWLESVDFGALSWAIAMNRQPANTVEAAEDRSGGCNLGAFPEKVDMTAAYLPWSQ